MNLFNLYFEMLYEHFHMNKVSISIIFVNNSIYVLFFISINDHVYYLIKQIDRTWAMQNLLNKVQTISQIVAS